MSFDLNIKNYKKRELEDIFELPASYDKTLVIRKETFLREKILADKTIGEQIKQNTFRFLKETKDMLIADLNSVTHKLSNIYNTDLKLHDSAVTIAGNTPIIDRPTTPYAQSLPSEFYSGIINPLKKRTIRQNLNIDTRFRDNYTKTSSSNFQFVLPKKFNDVINDDALVIYTKKLLLDSFNEWFATNQTDKKGQITLFAGPWRKSNVDEYNKAHIVIKREFLKNFNIKVLDKIGIAKKSNSVPRLFSRDIIYDSFIENKKLDIDNTELTTQPVGGHIISDMELIRMTSQERNEAFKSENISNEYKHDLNCRAMSSYHNLRMGVLRLSEYMEYIHLDDSSLNEIKQKKYNELRTKPILV